MLLFLVTSAVPIKNLQLCNNQFNGKQIRAVGDWTKPPWNPAEPYGLMKFNSTKCAYTLSVGGLKAYYNYAWKVIILINQFFQIIIGTLKNKELCRLFLKSQ